jgi:hypothetical protein
MPAIETALPNRRSGRAARQLRVFYARASPLRAPRAMLLSAFRAKELMLREKAKSSIKRISLRVEIFMLLILRDLRHFLFEGICE